MAKPRGRKPATARRFCVQNRVEDEEARGGEAARAQARDRVRRFCVQNRVENEEARGGEAARAQARDQHAGFACKTELKTRRRGVAKPRKRSACERPARLCAAKRRRKRRRRPARLCRGCASSTPAQT